MNECNINYTVMAHKGYFAKEAFGVYKENSKEVCRISGQRDDVGIIELDIRKSKDGILYCYHGTLFQYYITLKFQRNFTTLKQMYDVDSLKEILTVIPDTKIIFLDIKDTYITKGDIHDVFAEARFKEVILGNKSVSFLQHFVDLPQEFVKCLNGNIFCTWYRLEKLKADNFKYFEVVFPFQVRRKIIKHVRAQGLEFLCASLFFRSAKRYWRMIRKTGISVIHSDFV